MLLIFPNDISHTKVDFLKKNPYFIFICQLPGHRNDCSNAVVLWLDCACQNHPEVLLARRRGSHLCGPWFCRIGWVLRVCICSWHCSRDHTLRTTVLGIDSQSSLIISIKLTSGALKHKQNNSKDMPQPHHQIFWVNWFGMRPDLSDMFLYLLWCHSQVILIFYQDWTPCHSTGK